MKENRQNLKFRNGGTESEFVYLFVFLGECEALVLRHIGAEDDHGLVLAESRRALRLLLLLRLGESGAGDRRRRVASFQVSLEEGQVELGFHGGDRSRPWPRLRSSDFAGSEGGEGGEGGVGMSSRRLRQHESARRWRS